jgi:predicted hydrocarbon binding protein
MAIGSTEVRMKAGIKFFATFFNTVSDQVVRVDEDGANWKWHIERCPVCWGRKSDEPVCHLAVGVLNAASSWASGGLKFRIQETSCIAMGDPECVILIEKQPIG